MGKKPKNVINVLLSNEIGRVKDLKKLRTKKERQQKYVLLWTNINQMTEDEMDLRRDEISGDDIVQMIKIIIEIISQTRQKCVYKIQIQDILKKTQNIAERSEKIKIAEDVMSEYIEVIEVMKNKEINHEDVILIKIAAGRLIEGIDGLPANEEKINKGAEILYGIYNNKNKILEELNNEHKNEHENEINFDNASGISLATLTLDHSNN